MGVVKTVIFRFPKNIWQKIGKTRFSTTFSDFLKFCELRGTIKKSQRQIQNNLSKTVRIRPELTRKRLRTMPSAAEAVPIVIFRSPRSENRRGSFPASNRVITVFREIWRSFQDKFSICTERFRLISSGSFVYTLNSPLNPKLCAGSPTSRAEVVVFRSLRWVWVSNLHSRELDILDFRKFCKLWTSIKKYWAPNIE